MDCRTCEPTLIDLVHDELATDAAADSRAHLAECASCRASFERLASARKLGEGLELERPPQAIGARLIQLAEARAAELRAQAAPKAPPPSLARKLLDFVARFASGPQVGMATIMLLIVAVGLLSLPRMKREAVPGGTVVDAERDGEAAPSPGVVPADRLDLEVDPRARRIRSADAQKDLAQVPAAAAAQSAPAAVAEVAAPEPEPSAGEQDEPSEDPLAKLDDVDDLFEAKKEAPAAELQRLGQRSASDERRDQTLGGLGTGSAMEPRAAPPPAARAAAQPAPAPAPQAFPASPADDAEGELAAEASAATSRTQTQAQAPALEQQLRSKSKRAESQEASAAAGRAQGAAAPAQAPAAPAPARQVDLLQNAYRSGDGTSTQAASSLLDSARATTRARGCAAALPTYERTVATAPGTATAGTALIEMAQCKHSLGQTAEAQRLLERAAAIPATRERARALLDAP